jgi:hypothetical protein
LTITALTVAKGENTKAHNQSDSLKGAADVDRGEVLTLREGYRFLMRLPALAVSYAVATGEFCQDRTHRGSLPMALYKYEQFISRSEDAAFDKISEPGVTAPSPGKYRCEGCGHEVAIAMGHILPPQNHHQHTSAQGRIRWRLTVSHKAY